MRIFSRLAVSAIVLVSAVSAIAQNRGRLLMDPAVTAAARIDMIREAKSFIFQSAYEQFNDRIGQTNLALLWEAAKAGKRVIFLVDAQNAGMTPGQFAVLKEAGVEVYVFHPFDANAPVSHIYKRMHDKLQITDAADGTIRLIAGDSNIGNTYMGLSGASSPMVSKNIYLEGKSGAPIDAMNYFEKIIPDNAADPMIKHIEPLKMKAVTEADLYIARREFQIALESMPRRILRSVAGWARELRDMGNVQFFHDIPGVKGPDVGSSKAIYEALEGAKHTIVIENPYIVVTEEMKAVLRRKVAEGVKVTIVTNSVDTLHMGPLGGEWMASRKFFAEIGADVWEHSGDRTASPNRMRALNEHLAGEGELHAKTMTIDEGHPSGFAVISSWNADPRSQNLNLETGVIVRDPTTVKELGARVRKDLVDLKYDHTVIRGQIQSGAKNCSWAMRVLGRILKPQL